MMTNRTFSNKEFSKSLVALDSYTRDRVNEINSDELIKSTSGVLTKNSGKIKVTTRFNDTIELEYSYNEGIAQLVVNGKSEKFDISDFDKVLLVFENDFMKAMIYKYAKI